MTDISLRVENGKVVAYDQQGNKVPVPTEALDTDQADITDPDTGDAASLTYDSGADSILVTKEV